MKTRNLALAALSIVAGVLAHGDHSHGGVDDEWSAKYGPLPDLSFSGISTFAHLEHHKCLDTQKPFDVGILGVPFDTAVSFRPGARFGPFAIRAGSRRHAPSRGYSIPWGFNPFIQGYNIVDCGDVPVSPYDQGLAIDQIRVAYNTLLARPVATEYATENGGMKKLALDGKEHSKIITLGGDHTILLPILGALKDVYGPISVIHFDAHLDTWNGNFYVGASTDQSKITHGTFFWKAAEEGFITNTTSIHAGIRTRLSGLEDLHHDASVGFDLLTTDDIDDVGAQGIIDRIRKRIGDRPVYLSFDIDTIDPSMAPATGTPESGGWTMREVKRILRGLHGLNFVGADVVEVSPGYDHAEVTAMAAADLVQEFLALMVKKGERIPAISRGVLAEPIPSDAAAAEHDEL